MLNKAVLFKEVHEKTGERVSARQQVQGKGVEAPSGRLAQVSLRDAVVAQVEQGNCLRVNRLLEALSPTQSQKEVYALFVQLI